MNSSNLNTLQISTGMSIKEAMRQMDNAGEKTLFVVDDKKKLLGSLTDGDIRRWILKEGRLDEKVETACNSNPLFVKEPYDLGNVKKLMLKKAVEGIPVVDNDKKLIEVLLWRDILGDTRKPVVRKLGVPVVIMAGGKGTRLDPFTRILPKPLIPIGEKTIIDLIMDKFSAYGVDRFYITINHKARMIKSYFEETNDRYKIEYIEEEKPLGTAGSLRFLKEKIEKTILVSNCDMIIDCDYCEIVDFHNDNHYEMTIVGSLRNFTIPYGICEIEKNGLLRKITEKPEFDYLVNTGMCLIEKKALSLIPPNRVFHVTDLVVKIQETGGKVGVFPINPKSWIDVGRWEEYRNSVKLLKVD